MSSLSGKVGIVTGAANGIGRASALALAREGAALVLADRDEAEGAAACRAIAAAGGAAVFVATDVSDPAACLRMAAAAREHFGRLDFALNNAAIQGPAALLVDYPLDGWAATLATNLSGVFYCLRAEIPLMLASGGGAIVNVASISALISFQHQSAYVASKHGVLGLTKAACNEYGPRGIRCNAIAPGATETAMLPGGISTEFRDALPARRAAQPEEIAEAAVWLCSPCSSYVNGACLPVDGGYLVQ
jgi:NAD(P)-dependent dehydrogenase (short-subunit alcohol dehydrogenase family)